MKLKNQRYDYSNARRIKDVIPDAFVRKLHLPRADNSHLQKLNDRGKFVRGVFYDFLNLMLDDCIKNNNKFTSPNEENFVIYIREKAEAEQKRLTTKTSKIYVDVNLLESDFKFYEFVLRSQHLPKKKHRKIRIGHSKYKDLVREVNKGRRYYKS